MLCGNGKFDNYKSIQKMLDKCGIVRITKPGTYLIGKTLKIHSDTKFVLAPGVKLVAKPYSKCALIENDTFGIKDARNQNIQIIGGTWDGNCDNMGLDAVHEAKNREDGPYSPDRFKGKLIRFAGVDNIVLEKMTVKDPVSYGIQLADVNNYIVRDMVFDYNHHFGTTDGVHINGPATCGLLENLYGTTNDDMVGVTTIDETHAEVTVGEISNLTIKNVTAQNGYSGIRLLSAGGYAIKNTTISGVYGDYRHNAVLISHHYTRPNTPIYFDDIVVEKVHSKKSSTPLTDDCFTLWEGGIYEMPMIWLEEGINIGSITLRDIYREETVNTTGALIDINVGVNVDRLVLQNIRQKLVGDINPPCVLNGADAKTLIVDNVDGYQKI